MIDSQISGHVFTTYRLYGGSLVIPPHESMIQRCYPRNTFRQDGVLSFFALDR